MGSVEVAIARACGVSFKRTIRDMSDFELPRESVGETGSGSIFLIFFYFKGKEDLNERRRVTNKWSRQRGITSLEKMIWVWVRF